MSNLPYVRVSTRRQHGRRSFAERADQLHALLLAGPQTLAPLALAMGCSATAVMHYANRMPEVLITPTRAADGGRIYLVLALGIAP